MEAITTMVEFRITTMALGMEMGVEQAAISNQNHSNPSTPAKKYLSHITCFKCGKTGHYFTQCF